MIPNSWTWPAKELSFCSAESSTSSSDLDKKLLAAGCRRAGALIRRHSGANQERPSEAAQGPERSIETNREAREVLAVRNFAIDVMVGCSRCRRLGLNLASTSCVASNGAAFFRSRSSRERAVKKAVQRPP